MFSHPTKCDGSSLNGWSVDIADEKIMAIVPCHLGYGWV